MNANSETTRWIRELMRRHGVPTIEFGENEYGLINVPQKWGSLIGDLTAAIQLLAAGEKLPPLKTEEPKKKRRGGGP